MSDFPVEELTIARYHQALKKGEITTRELVLTYLDRIAGIDKDGPCINSVLEINPDALFLADYMDGQLQKGRSLGPLHGVPILLKDNINTGDKLHTTAGALALRDNYAPEDSFVVKRLREAGALIFGKANMIEMANFVSTTMRRGFSSRGGLVKNPYKLSGYPSGSSTGSAVAAAANLTLGTLGTDTTGSILYPSSYNCVVGIKPSRGLVSHAGVCPISLTLDTVGPIARTVEDAARILSAIEGYDPADPATLRMKGVPLHDYAAALDKGALKGARIGLNLGYYGELSPAEQALADRAVDVLREAGAVLIPGCGFPMMNYNTDVATYEFKACLNAYLASLSPRNDIRTLEDMIEYNRAHADVALKYGQDRLEQCQYHTSGTLTDPAYIHALLENEKTTRDGICRVMAENRLDALFCPKLTDLPAFSGYPAVNVPAGLADGVPMGVTLIGRPMDETGLLRIAYAYEQASCARVLPTYAP